MTLGEWAARWGVSDAALAELAGVNVGAPLPPSRPVTSESALQSLVRLEAAARGVYLWRNNVGVLEDETGRPVRYGLGNDSKAVNRVIKSGDLIGLRPRLIQPSDVGRIIGQFVSRECKRPDWKWRNTPEEQAQLRWATLINSHGGDAAIINYEGSM